MHCPRERPSIVHSCGRDNAFAGGEVWRNKRSLRCKVIAREPSPSGVWSGRAGRPSRGVCDSKGCRHCLGHARSNPTCCALHSGRSQREERLSSRGERKPGRTAREGRRMWSHSVPRTVPATRTVHCTGQWCRSLSASSTRQGGRRFQSAPMLETTDVQQGSAKMCASSLIHGRI